MGRERREQAGYDWTDREIDEALDVYQEMLANQEAGRTYTKSALVRGLAERIPARTKGSIERKFGNVSAILIAMGLPWVQGYKPYGNVQGALRDRIEERAARRERQT